MKFFKKVIKTNPGHALSNSILITARRCVSGDAKWYAELNLPGNGYAPLDSIQGSKKMVKAFVNNWLKSHKG